MQFLYYHKDTTYGSFHITNTNICDILAEIQPDDIIDGLDCVGIRVNRYFENISDNDYVLWICDPRTEVKEIFMKMYDKNNKEDVVEEFKISADEIQAIIDYFSQWLQPL